MASIIRCAYCANWQASPIRKVITENDEGNNSKKKKKKEKIKQFRICNITNRRVQDTTEACRYFKPRLYFYCYSSRYWLSIYQCLHRRRNRTFYLQHKKDPTKKPQKKYMYPNCTSRCPQFRDDILPICKKLKINRFGQIKKPRIIKRRDKKEHRIIKRRIKKVTRAITRRPKKVGRVIKRRE